MEAAMSQEAFEELIEAATAQLPDSSAIAERCMAELQLPLCWTSRFLSNGTGTHCEILLRGCYGSAVESVSLIALGLLRPAVLSLRSYYELSLQFLYYKDHPVEWRNVLDYRSQPTLPGVNKKYLKDNYSDFELRTKELLKKKRREHDDCYDVLSGVAHGTAYNSISQAASPKELLVSCDTLEQSEQIFLSTSEYLSDIHVASFEGNWLSLPDEVRGNLETRFGAGSGASALKMQ